MRSSITSPIHQSKIVSPLIPSEIIQKKRDGGKLSRAELQLFIKSYLSGGVAEYQMSAFLMAVYFRGMDAEETGDLTDEMVNSGVVVDLSGIPGIKVDKHSTGGGGDKVSLILAPMVAACGVPVPMMSGRGLGHTGGTLDKLESIPGFRTNLSLMEYKKVLADIGLAMIGQTAEIAPADKKMYALRDVTGTVESIPLIAGSIMSKKIAEGIDALVLDVKTGRGAFMQSEEEAIKLAQTLLQVGAHFGKKSVALLTDMSQPLGFAVGNWLEVEECIDCLNGRDVSDLMELTYALGGLMTMLGGKARSASEGISLCRDAVRSGKALVKFKELVARQGGDRSVIDHPLQYAKAKHTVEVKSPASGIVQSIDAREIGLTSIMLGAGRLRVDDKIDPKAGIMLRKKTGDAVKSGETLAVIHTDKEAIVAEAARRVAAAFGIAGKDVKRQSLIRSLIDETGVRPWPEG